MKLKSSEAIRVPKVLATFVTALGVSLVYWLTLAPSVLGGDAGELIAATSAGGVLHPPGYPLYSLLGRLFLVFPTGEAAWRMNLFSSVAAVCAAVMVQRACARWSGSAWAGVCAASFFAFSPVVWEHSVGAEVFALHHVFVAALLWLAVLYADTAAPRWVWIGALVAALGMSHHHTILFFAAPLGLWPLLRQPAYWLKSRRLLLLLGIGLIGLSPYMILFWRSPDIPVTWGDWTSLGGFWRHFTRAEYGSFQLASSELSHSGGWGWRLIAWLRFEGAGLYWGGFCLVGIGLVSVWREQKWRALAVGSLLTVAVYVLLFNWLANLSTEDALPYSVLTRFWTAPHLIFCVWMGLGLSRLFHAHPKRLFCSALMLSLIPLSMNWQVASRRGVMEFAEYGTAWLAPLPAGAVLLMRGDLIVNTVSYRYYTQNFRSDLRVLDLERMTYPWFKQILDRTQPKLVVPGDRYHPHASNTYSLAALIDANPQLGPWFVAGDLSEHEMAALPGWTLRPFGMGWHLVPPGERFDFEAWWMMSGQALPQYEIPSVLRQATDAWARAVADDYYEARNRRGIATLTVAGLQDNSPVILHRAIEAFEAAAENARTPARVYKNVGIAWQRLEGSDPEAMNQAIEAWQRYLELEDGSDPQAAIISEWLQDR
ncbi:glycosyltransferase family 117 protein [Coraliomargarita sp. W4R53]